MQTKENSINGTSALIREIIVIDPTVQEKSALKQRVAAYARVSSNSDDQLNSFAAQIGHYTDLFSSHHNRGGYIAFVLLSPRRRRGREYAF